MKRRSRALAGAAAVALCGLLPPPVAAVQNPEPACSDSHVVFCSGFEEGSFAIWDDYDGNPLPYNQLVSDPGPLSDSSNHVARFYVPPGEGGADLVKVMPATYDRLFVRWYEKWEPGYDFTVPNHGGGLHAGSRDYLGVSGYRPTGSNFFASYLEPYAEKENLYTYYPGMYQDCADPNGACWGDHFPCFVDNGANYCTKPQDRPTIMPPQMQSGRWYCLEETIDAGAAVPNGSSANGSLDFWIDGVEYGPWTNLWFRTTPSLKIGVLWLSTYFHGAHADVGVLMDNVVVSTQRIGCLDSPPPNPPPAAPANLHRLDKH